MILGNTTVFRLVITAAVLGWGAYLVLPEVWPDARYTSLADDVRSNGNAETAHKLTQRYRYDVATFDGKRWVLHGRPYQPRLSGFAQQVLETPICTEQECKAFMARKTQKPFLPLGSLSHRFILVWSEADGKVLELFEVNRLWQW